MQRPVRFCPYCGTPTEIRTHAGEQRPTCPSCGWVHYEDPKVAAAVVVEAQDGRVLLTRRVMSPYQGYWTLPAGFVNAYEDPARAAERECLEETGLTVQVTGLLQIVAGREHERGADMVIVYAAKVTGGTLQAGDDADRAAFFERDHLPPLAFRATRVALGLQPEGTEPPPAGPPEDHTHA
jgi:ADP-ribose pyrophosphatase YjhB (NUDIX family)